jgi:excisionase family DNA binding protein
MVRRVAVHTLEVVPQQHPEQRGNKRDPRHSVDVMARSSDRMLLTVEEAAEQLGVGRSTMYQLIAAGLIDTTRIGRLRRIEPDALATYIARLRKQPDPAA